MGKIINIVRELKELLSNEEYEKAYKIVNKRGVELIAQLSPSSLHRQLLLCICSVFSNNNDERFNKYLSIFESIYSNACHDSEYIKLKYNKLIVEGNHSQALALLKNAITNDWTKENYHTIALYLSDAYFWNGNYIEADQYLQNSYRYYLSNSNHRMLGHTLYLMGYIAFQRSLLSMAESYFIKALLNFKTAKKDRQIAKTYKMLGILNYRTGRYCEAKENLKLAKKSFNKCSSFSSILYCQIGQARIAIFEGEYNKAEDLLARANKEAIDAGFKRIEALSAEFLGEVYYRQRNYEKSLSYLNEALTLALEIAPRGDIPVEVYRRLGDVYIALGRIEEAEDMLSKALKLCNHLGDKYELGSVYRAMGIVAIHKNDIDLAMSFFNEAVVTLKLIKESFELAATYVTAAEEYVKWSKREDTEEGLKRELLREARNFAVEAMHLYSSIKLNDRVLYCEHLIDDIDKVSEKDIKKVSSVKLSFNPKWLYGDNLVARSSEMKEVVSKSKQLAKTEISILITGETGTGKEVVARHIHRMSDRAKGPFVAVNCASIPDDVFESELFGHRRGSFTGAFSDKKGLMEEADGGTLFLDEISELSGRQQAKLLRALEGRKIRRVGEAKERDIDIRILSASNENVSYLLKSKRLREDLYYRIAAENIKIKPLRERKRDIEALFSYYLHNQSNDGYRIGEGVLRMLNKHHWPGNVRELVNLTDVLSGKGNENKIIFTDDFPLDIRDSSSSELDKSSITKNLRG
ncbi:MAG TPA: sigma 54-interacting transcriptional regulator, partial [Candidatus Krumholzibacteriaceae bacterium]|nr:sigma 54-interacting transcriptional regulator [Candidatus Krumholzibacteriaceae bacterium]